MAETHPSTDVLTDRIELYMALDATNLYKYFTADNESVAVYEPAYALAQTEITQTGINSLSSSTKRLACFAANSQEASQHEFCFHQAVSTQLTDIENWFDFNSIYEPTEREGAQVHPHETTDTVSLDDSGCISLIIDYTANDLSADSHSLRCRLFYGGPWHKPAAQHLTVTGYTERIPTGIEEVISFVNGVLRANPVNDIPMCCLDNDTTGESEITREDTSTD